MRSSLRKHGKYSSVFMRNLHLVSVCITSFIRYITLSKGLLPKSKALQELNVY